MVVEGISSNLDGFYNELRRKYPRTFTLVTDLGQERSPLQRLPALEFKDVIIPDRKSPLPVTQVSPDARWTTNSFFSKVQFQKIHNAQKCTDLTQHKHSPVIINNNAIFVPSWNIEQVTSGHRDPSVQLPTLTSQIDQNQAVLRTRLQSQKAVTNRPSGSIRSSDPLRQCSVSSQCLESHTLSRHRSIRDCVDSPRNMNEEGKKISTENPDPLGTIMKDLLPNKPGKVLHKDRKEVHNRNGSCSVDAGCKSGIHISLPANIFRLKPTSPERSPTQSEIIKKFSAKPKIASGPLRADHTIGKSTLIQTVETTKSVTIHSDSTTSTKDDMKPERRMTLYHVHFEDESLKDAECRYQERVLLGKREGYLGSEGHLALQETKSNDLSAQSSLAQSQGRHLADESSRLQLLPFTVVKQGCLSMDSENIIQSNGKELVALDEISLNFPSHSHNPSSSLMSTEWQNHGEQRALKKADEPNDGNLSCSEIFHSSEREMVRQPLRLQSPQSSRPIRNVQVSIESASTGRVWSGAALKQTQHPRLKMSSSTHSSRSPPDTDHDCHWPLMGSSAVKKQHSVKEMSYLYSKVKQTLQSYVRKSPAEGLPRSVRQAGATSEMRNHIQLMDSAGISKCMRSERTVPSIHHPITSACDKERSGEERGRMPCPMNSRPACFPRTLLMRAFVKKEPARNYLLHLPKLPLQPHRQPSKNPEGDTLCLSGSRSTVRRRTMLRPVDTSSVTVHSESSCAAEWLQPKSNFCGSYTTKVRPNA